MAHVICTACWNRIEATTTPFRCTNPDPRDPKTPSGCPGYGPDQVFDQYHQTKSGLAHGRVIEVTNPIAPGVTIHCPDCGRDTRLRICSVCHSALPTVESGTDQQIISLIGGRTTGKTIYIATLIHKLRESVLGDFKLTSTFVPSESQIRWEEGFEKPLFRQGQLPFSQRAVQNPDMLVPIIVRLQHMQQRNRHLDLYFFDSSGEDQDDDDSIARYVRQLMFSSGIIFMLDPLQFAKVNRDDPSPRKLASDLIVDPSRIFNRIINAIEREHRVPKIPVAFTLTKLDRILHYFDGSSPLRQPIHHRGTLDMRAVENTSLEVEWFLNQQLGGSFTSSARTWFPRHKFFGVSCLGCDAKKDSSLVYPPACYRVEEPLLWLLHELNNFV